MAGVKWGAVDQTVNPDRVIIVASGKSLIGFNFHTLYDKGYFIISLNDTGSVVPHSNAWITVDPWGLAGKQYPQKPVDKIYAAVPEDFGTKHAACGDHRIDPPETITYLRRVSHQNSNHLKIGVSGLAEDPTEINTGNSGYGALNLAYHLRPKKVLLLGLDAGHGYFFTTRKANRGLDHLPSLFLSAVPQLEAAGIEVINGSIKSGVTAFPRYNIIDAIKKFDE